jgi:hypothetical protein
VTVPILAKHKVTFSLAGWTYAVWYCRKSG